MGCFVPFVMGLGVCVCGGGALTLGSPVHVLFAATASLSGKAPWCGAQREPQHRLARIMCWAHFWEERDGFQIVSQWQLAALLFFN